eukprot:CAMPEP_0182855386 /NCGR_PEP_ID=MMETSP0034_2-20130328/1807_1 /TAXON_ID=156128 /ORGANISM="Nephroselmis pyriformis, Strain CCMP717" /LENGTH=129 /DNA_ID=CAMNT_0024986335 /DNA_START=105 /DNA_END=492 /DNA_ORIENTATION=-
MGFRAVGGIIAHIEQVDEDELQQEKEEPRQHPIAGLAPAEVCVELRRVDENEIRHDGKGEKGEECARAADDHARTPLASPPAPEGHDLTAAACAPGAAPRPFSGSGVEVATSGSTAVAASHTGPAERAW